MTKYILITLLSACSAINGIAQTNKFSLQVNTKRENSKLYIIDKSNRETKMDSLFSKTGTFVMDGTVDEAHKVELFLVDDDALLKKYNNGMTIWIEKGKIKVNTESNILDYSANLSGTPLNEDLNKINLLKKKHIEETRKIEKDYLNAKANKDVIIMQSLRDSFDIKKEQYEKLQLTFFKNNTNSLVSLDWLISNKNIIKQNTEVKSLFALLSDNVKSSKAGKEFESKLQKTLPVELNALAPDFSSTSLDGKIITLSKLRGKYVLLDFWASWCGPCRHENPNLVSVYNEFSSKGFTILGFSLDSKKASWEKAVNDDKLIWNNVSDLKGWKSNASKLYDIHAVPSNVLIDPNGYIIAFNLRGEELGNKLREILK